MLKNDKLIGSVVYAPEAWRYTAHCPHLVNTLGKNFNARLVRI